MSDHITSYEMCTLLDLLSHFSSLVVVVVVVVVMVGVVVVVK